MGRRGESLGERQNGAAPVSFRSPSIWRGARPRQEWRRAAIRNPNAAIIGTNHAPFVLPKDESELPLALAHILVTAAARLLATSYSACTRESYANGCPNRSLLATSASDLRFFLPRPTSVAG